MCLILSPFNLIKNWTFVNGGVLPISGGSLDEILLSHEAISDVYKHMLSNQYGFEGKIVGKNDRLALHFSDIFHIIPPIFSKMNSILET